MHPVFTHLIAAVLCCLALATAPLAAQAGAPVISDNVKKGNLDSTALPYPGTSVQWGRAVLMVDAPADKVMSVLQNYGSYREFMPNFTTSRVLSQRGTSALLYVELGIMNGAAKIWAELKLREAKGDGITRVIEGTMNKGNVKLFQARWEVTQVEPNKTLVAVQMIVDPDLPVPSSIITSENQKSARKAMRALRDRLAAPAAKPAK
jgi:ribosome-associated toxin RatA of RatAB toxin-antitoxin module